jgi:hypothetical protein
MEEELVQELKFDDIVDKLAYSRQKVSAKQILCPINALFSKLLKSMGDDQALLYRLTRREQMENPLNKLSGQVKDGVSTFQRWQGAQIL